jgi:hypothetical protein
VNTRTSGSVAVRNTPYNGSLAANSAAPLGFTATGSSTAAPGNIACESP